MEFKYIPLLDIGNTVQIAGVLYQGAKEQYLFMLPGERIKEGDTQSVNMTDEDWIEFLKQNDNASTEVIIGNVKAIVRKCQRVIDQNVSWTVYRRDSYKCRYCAADKTPLTVDHIDLWELGGVTIVDNLLTCCKKCNKIRGNTPYKEWLKSPEYASRSVSLTEVEKKANEAVVQTLPFLEKQRATKMRSR